MLASTSPAGAQPAALDPSLDLEDLRARYETLKREVGDIVEARAAQAQRIAEDSTEAVRDTIADNPLLAVAGALAVGAAIGVLMTPATPPSRYEVVRDDLASYADDLRRSLDRSVKNSSLLERFDRMAEAVSSTSSRETIQPLFDRVLGWISQTKDQAIDAVDATARKVMGQ